MNAGSASQDAGLGEAETDLSGSFESTMFKIAIGLVGVACVIGAFQRPTPWGTVSVAPFEVILGMLGAFPLFLVVYSSGHFNDVVLQRVVPHLKRMSTGSLVGLAVLLALGEELFFRGLIPSLASGLDPMWALVLANAIYGACYAVNKGGAITMFLFGCYLSALMSSGDTTNIVRPIIAHAVFLVIMLPLLARVGHSREQDTADASATTESDSVE